MSSRLQPKEIADLQVHTAHRELVEETYRNIKTILNTFIRFPRYDIGAVNGTLLQLDYSD